MNYIRKELGFEKLIPNDIYVGMWADMIANNLIFW